MKIITDGRNSRIHNATIDIKTIEQLHASINHIDLRTFLSVPAEHFRAAKEMQKLIGDSFVEHILVLLKNRKHGAVTIKLPTELNSDILKIAIVAISNLIGKPRKDSSFNPLAIFKSFAQSEFINTDTMRTLPLHNDGTYYNGPTDWNLLALTSGGFDSSGGCSLLLHIDDWLMETPIFSKILLERKFRFEGPPLSDSRKNIFGDRGDTTNLELPIFYKHKSYGLSCRVAHQWIHPKNYEEASIVLEIIDSLKKCEENSKFKLRENELYIVNNHVWLHGRKKLIKSGLSRISVRVFGEFL